MLCFISESEVGELKRVKQKIKNMAIFQKMLVICLLVTILISMISGGITYSIGSDIIMKKTVDQMEGTIAQLSKNYDSFMELINNRADYIAFNPTVQEELARAEPEEEGYFSGYRIVKRLLVQMFKSTQMEDIEIYGENGTNYFCSIRGNVEPVLENEDQLKRIATENMGAVTYVNDISSSGCIQVVKLIKDNLSMESLGVLRIGIRISALKNIQSSADLTLQGNILMLDSENQVIIGEENEITDQAETLFAKWNDSFQYQINGDRYHVVYQMSDYTGFKTVAILPAKEITSAVTPLQLATMTALVVGLFLSIALSIFMSRFMSNPIRKTVEALHKVSKGDFSVRLEDGRKDEFGEINREFNHTIERMEILLEEIAESRIQNKEMEFKALQAQINPHFLYNALDTINWMARIEGKEEICEMISAVSGLLRISISNKEVLFTVDKELEYVKDYLYIQKTRYRNRFTVDFDIEDGIKNQLLPKLTIQPLVENVIVHSVEVSKEKTKLEIRGYKTDEEVHIEIEDTGVGMSKETLANLLVPQDRKDDVKAAHTGIGTYAVHQRLQLMFGEEYGLSVDSEEGIGTCITIRFPFEKEQDGEQLLERAKTFMSGRKKNGTERDDS